MDKLRRVLSGDEPTPEEESSIITQVKKFSNGTDLIRSLNIFWLEELWLWRGLGASRWQRPPITWRPKPCDPTLIKVFS